MDRGHYNCRDYYVSPHFAPTTVSTLINKRPPFLFRHESFDELEQRSRSPRSRHKFPLLKLPAELRQQIFSYLLPRTIEHRESDSLLRHVQNFSAVKKRVAKCMVVPQFDPSSRRAPGPVVWRRGNISLLSVNKQIHDECAEVLYGSSTFQLFVTYSGISFRYSWILQGGGTPSRRYDFLELLPKKYLVLIKKVIVHVDHVDSYTGMIKFNVSGKGLTYGLRKQIQRLVNALQFPVEHSQAAGEDIDASTRRMGKVQIRVSNGNAVLDQIKSDTVRQREGGVKVAEDIEEMLEPFGYLRGVRDVKINGAVTESFASSLRSTMMSVDRIGPTERLARSLRDLDLPPVMSQDPRLCVYGNDI